MAQRYNTGNQRPSNSMKDLNDNTLAYDDFMNGEQEVAYDRFQKPFPTVRRQVAERIDEITGAQKSIEQYADEAKQSADDAQNIADANTYYVTPEDPDGTIAGLAGTPNGKSFRVGLGVGKGFKTYVNNNGVALEVSGTPGTSEVTANTSIVLKTDAELTSISGARSQEPIAVEPGIYQLSTGNPIPGSTKEIRSICFIYLNSGDRLAVPRYYNVAGVFYDSPTSSSYNGGYFTYAREYVATNDMFVRLVFKYVGSDQSVNPQESVFFEKLTIIRNDRTPLLNVPNGSLSANLLNLDALQTDFYIEPGSISGANGIEQPSTTTFVHRTRMIPTSTGDKYMIIDPAYVYCPFYYSKSGQFISSPGVWLDGELNISNNGFVRFTTKRLDEGEGINDLQFASWIDGPSAISMIPVNIGTIPENAIPLNKLKTGEPISDFPITPGTLNAGNGNEMPPTATFVHRTGMIPLSVGDAIYLTDENYYYCPFYYSETGSFISSDAAWHTEKMISTINGFVRFSTKRRDNSDEISEHATAEWIAVKSAAIITETTQMGSSVVDEKNLTATVREKLNSQSSGASQWAGKLWFSIGDSITERSWYQPLVVDLLGMSGFENYGIGGTCVAKINTNDNNAMSVRYENITGNPDVITVWGGVNDFGYGYGSGSGNALGAITDTDNTTFYGALRVLLEGLVTKFPNAKLAFVITTPVSLDKGMKSPNAKGFYLADYCRAAREVCEEYSIPYLDLQKVSGFNQQNIAVMTSNIAGTASDGLHPSRRGMAWIATKLAAFLQGI